ncbi:MAG: magnesium transporter, partial [Bacteroidota bacterium]
MAEERNKNQTRLKRVRKLLRTPQGQTHIRSITAALHPTELAQLLEDAPLEIKEKILRQVPTELLSEAISEMDEEANPAKLLTLLEPKYASDLIAELAPDDAVDLLAQLPESLKDRILHFVPDEDELLLNQLLDYDEESAGGLMNPDVISVLANMTKLDALREAVNQSEDTEDFYAIYVVDENGHLEGYVTIKNLFQARNSETVENIMDSEIISVNVHDDQEAVAKIMSQYNLPTLPVVDDIGVLLGRITFDDILDVLEDETTEDILNFAGVSEDENLRGGWADAVKSRMPWLLINLITAFLASQVIRQFDDIISEMAVLASFMPIIAGVAGNGATQTLAVTIRRISTDGVPARKAFQVIMKEVLVGMINGIILGTLVSLIAVIRGDDPKLGIVVAVALFGNLFIAGLMGSLVPLTLERLRVDPAVASSIFITAFTDIMGYTLLFGLT